MPQQTWQEIAAIFAWVKQFGTFIMELLVSASYQVDKLTAEYVWKGWKFKIQHIFLSLQLSLSQKIWLCGHNHLPEDREQMSVQPLSTELPNLAKCPIPFPICCIHKHSWGGIAAGGAKHQWCFRPGRFPPLFISMTWTLWSSCFPSLLTCNSPLCQYSAQPWRMGINQLHPEKWFASTLQCQGFWQGAHMRHLGLEQHPSVCTNRKTAFHSLHILSPFLACVVWKKIKISELWW